MDSTNNLLNKFESVTNQINWDFKIDDFHENNQIKIRRLQNAMMQISEYKTSITDLLNETGSLTPLPGNTAEMLLKLFLEFCALLDTLLMHSKNILNKDLFNLKREAISFVSTIEECLDQSTPEDAETLEKIEILTKDLFTQINRW